MSSPIVPFRSPFFDPQSTRDTPGANTRYTQGTISREWIQFFKSLSGSAATTTNVQNTTIIQGQASAFDDFTPSDNKADIVNALLASGDTPRPAVNDLIAHILLNDTTTPAASDPLAALAFIDTADAPGAASTAVANLQSQLGSAAYQPTTAFDAAGAWSTWTGDVNAGGNNLSAVNNISAASLQVTSYMNFSGSMFYLGGAGTYFRTANNTVSNWQEFAYYDVAGANAAADQWGLYVNTRSSAGGADGWFPVMQVNAQTGNTQFNVPVTITATLSASILKSTGGVYSGVRTVTANDTATTSDHTIILNGASLTETLPASPGAGQELYLVNIAATSATINGNSKSIWVAGTSSASITLAANTTTILQYDGTLWRVIK